MPGHRSPPLQQLSLEEINGTEVILGVGPQAEVTGASALNQQEQGAARRIQL